MKRTKMEKGITLIALIITIVVLLILAVVAIAAIRNDGILAHAENAANKYNQAQQNEQGILGEYEQLLNENDGNGGTGEDDNPPVTTVEPTVGQYVKYNVGYTDMYSTSKTFGETDGWRYLGTDESGNKLIISTGIPMKLYYQYDTAGGSTKWWGTSGNENIKVTYGMLNNFDKIPFVQKASGTSMGIGEENTAIGAFAPSKRTYNGAEYDAVGDYFKATGQPYSSKIVKVRTLTLAELNRATNSARAGESGYTDRTDTSEDSGFKDIPEGNAARGLFDLSQVSGLSNNYYYWLASPNAGSTFSVYHVTDYDGRVLGSGRSFFIDEDRGRGVRPVVVLSSEVQFTDADGDGVLEIN